MIMEQLNQLEVIRKRPKLYIGELGTPGVTFAAREIILHLKALGATEVTMRLISHQMLLFSGLNISYTITDDCQRDPVIAAFTTLYACQCHQNDADEHCNPVVAVGISSKFTVHTTHKNNNKWYVWEKGVLVKTENSTGNKFFRPVSDPSAIHIWFTPDNSIVGDWKSEDVCARLKEEFGDYLHENSFG